MELTVGREVGETERDLLLLARPLHATALGDQGLENLRRGGQAARVRKRHREERTFAMVQPGRV